MPRPLEKTCMLDTGTIREMMAAYGSEQCIAHVLGVSRATARTALRGEGFRPEEFEDLIERWKVVNPAEIRPLLAEMHEQFGPDVSVIETDWIAAEELIAFFNALFPGQRIE